MFDGAKNFGHFAVFTVVTAILVYPVAGCGVFVAVGVALFYNLVMNNALERRDLQDRQAKPSPPRKGPPRKPHAQRGRR